MVRISILDRIFRKMQNILFRLDDLKNNISSWKPQPIEIPESKFIALPDHPRRTYMVVASKGECSANLVSNFTGLADLSKATTSTNWHARIGSTRT
jgi:hypothetical protein